MSYLIHESKYESVHKKLLNLARKCERLNCPFTYEILGEEYQVVDKVAYKFIRIEVSGVAVINNWEFCGTIEPHDGGNLVRQAPNAPAIPERYRTCELTCDHCGTNHFRKSTIIIHNTETDEYKQVGKQCLKLYTGGLDAEAVVSWLDGIAEFEAQQDPERMFDGLLTYGRYYRVIDVLEAAARCITILGYTPSQSTESVPTKIMAMELINPDMILRSRSSEKELYDRLVENNYESIVVDVDAMIDWISAQNTNTDYMHNLALLAQEEFISVKEFGFLCSLPLAYNKAKAKEEAKLKAKTGNYIASVGEKVKFAIKNYRIVTGFDGNYGTTFLVQFTDEAGNVCTWFTANPKSDIPDGSLCTATCKAQKEYRGVKQTVLTRCKFT